MNVVRAAAVAVIVRRIELAHCLTPWLQLSVLQHNTFVLTVEFFSVKMHEKKDFLFLFHSIRSYVHKYVLTTLTFELSAASPIDLASDCMDFLKSWRQRKLFQSNAFLWGYNYMFIWFYNHLALMKKLGIANLNLNNQYICNSGDRRGYMPPLLKTGYLIYWKNFFHWKSPCILTSSGRTANSMSLVS